MKNDKFTEELKELLSKHDVKGYIVLANFNNGQLRVTYDGMSVLEMQGAKTFLNDVIQKRTEVK
jgi:hypothetical protein